jgi:hypothetical protein
MSSLDSIVAQQQQLLSRLSLIEKHISENSLKMSEIESSQKFLSKKCHNVLSDVNVNKVGVKQLQGEAKVTSHNHAKLVKENRALRDDIVDLQCRSMRDNLIFVGVLEAAHVTMQPTSVSNASTTAGGASMMETSTTTYSTVAATVEDCVNKVLTFCQTQLGIDYAANTIQIVRAHRIGRRGDRPRPILAKFVRTENIDRIKSKLKEGKLHNTTYAVHDQYPECVRERRRELIPVMVDARKRGKRAVLTRDKLYINGQLYASEQP